MAEIAFASAKKLAALVRGRKIGCLELLDHYIARVERLDPKLNAVVVRDFDRARRRAKALDRKKKSTGPLHGVPMTVKESFDIAGLPSTWGYPEKRDNVAAQNALAVDRLQDAGAVIFGKTNVPRSLADWQSYNEVYGTTNNPWNPAHTPGGSSGGAAAAIAAGLSGLEIGSDIGGSIRQPAHANGVFGHKPTWGLCPPRGHSLTGAAAMTDISVIGPLARSPDDLAIALDALAGPDPEETELVVGLPPPRARSLDELRVAIWAEQHGQATEAATTAALHALARELRRAGAKVSQTARPAFDVTEAYHTYLGLMCAAMSARWSDDQVARSREFLARLAPDDVSVDAVLARSVGLPHPDWLALNEKRHHIRRAWAAFFRDWDVLICPIAPSPALPHMQEGELHERRIAIDGSDFPYDEQLFWPGLTCGFHLPATTIPLGQSASGLPFGAQIVGPLYGDRTTIAVARLLQRAWRGFTAPAGWA